MIEKVSTYPGCRWPSNPVLETLKSDTSIRDITKLTYALKTAIAFSMLKHLRQRIGRHGTFCPSYKTLERHAR